MNSVCNEHEHNEECVYNEHYLSIMNIVHNERYTSIMNSVHAD